MPIATLLLILDLLLWIGSILQAVRYGLLGRLSARQQEQVATDSRLPSVSVVITTHNQKSELQTHLPLFLEQDYDEPFEVIVVDIHSTDDTLDMLEHMEEHYPHLHHTFCPATARGVSLQRLSMTLGIKAADSEWVVLTQADCSIPGKDWLRHLMQPCQPGVDAVMGMNQFHPLHRWVGRKWQFFHLWQQMLYLPYAQHHTPYRADTAVLCYRKQHFMDHQGFASNLNLKSGAETLLVNHNIRPGRCRLALHPRAQVYQQQPADRLWRQEQVFFMEIRRHLRHTIAYRLLYAAMVSTSVLYPLLTAWLIFHFRTQVMLIIALSSAWLFSLIVRIWGFHSSTRKLGVRPYLFTLPLLTLFIPLWDARAWLTWRMTRRKNIFLRSNI